MENEHITTFERNVIAMKIDDINDLKFIMENFIVFNDDFDGSYLYIFCENTNGITVYTTRDFVYYGFDRKEFNSWDCEEVNGKCLIRKYKLKLLENL